MKLKLAAAAVAASLALSAHAVTEIQWWHSMTAVNGEWVNDLAKNFNATRLWLLSALATPPTSCKCLKSAPPP